VRKETGLRAPALLLLLDRRYTESPVCKMNVAVFSSYTLLSWSLVCNWTAVGPTFVLAVCRGGHLCSISSAVWSSRPQLQVGDGASFVFLNMWALTQLWPVRSILTATCCHRSRTWKSSLSLRCPRAGNPVSGNGELKRSYVMLHSHHQNDSTAV